jgi:hypothetical protein
MPASTAKRPKNKRSCTEKTGTYLEINVNDMKKLLIIAVIALGSVAMSACHRNSCPSFSQVELPADHRA